MCKFSSKRLLFCFKGKWWWSEGPVPRAGPRGAAGLGTLPHARCGGAHTQTWFEAHQSWIGEEYLGSTRWWKVLAPFDLGKCCLKIKKKRKKKWLVQFQNKFSQILKRKRSKKKKKKNCVRRKQRRGGNKNNQGKGKVITALSIQNKISGNCLAFSNKIRPSLDENRAKRIIRRGQAKRERQLDERKRETSKKRSSFKETRKKQN